MTSIIKLTALSGDQDGSPLCYLLQIDQFKCLLDCGWDEHFSQDIVNEIGKHFATLDAILLTYPDPYHLGALPYLIKKYGLSCPVYSTRPVKDMGKMFMTDLVHSNLNGKEFDTFTVEDVNKAFEKIKHLSYLHPLPLEGQGYGLTITALPAGHMVGGTIWKIIKDNEEDIVYAVDYNHKKERHLNGCVIEAIQRPSLLITDAYNALNTQIRMKERDKKFISTLLETLQQGGNVLIACDTAGRVLELCFMLDKLWNNKELGFPAYSLALVNSVSSKMIDIAKSTIEFMSDAILKDFDSSRENPFSFKYLQLKQRLDARDEALKHEALSSLPQDARMTVLATQPDLESGYSRDLFTLWCQDERNSIIFTQRPGPNTLGEQIFNMPSTADERLIDLEIRQRIELEGEELKEYLKKEEEKKAIELAETLKTSKVEDSESEESGDESDKKMRESDRSLISTSRINKHDLMMRDGKTKGPVFFKQARKTHLMFPAPPESRMKWDDYGEMINPEDYEIYHKLPEADMNENKENRLGTDAEKKDLAAIKLKPTKCVSIRHTLNVKAKICYFDFEGRSDGESVKNLMSQIKPRRLVLVRGSPESSAYMADYCRAYVDDKIFVSKCGETIDVTTENHIYQAKLKDSLVSSLNFVRTDDDVELAWVDVKTSVPDDDEMGGEKLPYLEAVAPEDIPLHKALFVNEFKLSDFKQVLVSNGIQAELSGGALFCNDKVAIKRKETGKLHLEGILCPEYFKVRDLLYQQHVII